MNPIILNGNELGLGIIRSLGMMDIKSVLIYHSQDEISRVSKHVSKTFKCPSWSNFEGVKHFLINNKPDVKDGILIPAEDRQVEFLSKNKKELAKFYTVPVPDYNIVKMFLDKKETYKIAQDAGVDFPSTFYPKTKAEALTNAQTMMFPLMIKPRDRDRFIETFKKKLFIVKSKKELNKKLELCFKDQIKIMLTDIIPGSDNLLYEYDFYVNKKGELTCGLSHVKLRQAPPKYGVGRVIKTTVNKEVEKLTKKFLKHMPGFYGPGQLEFKYDVRDKKYKLIEFNGRLTLQNALFAKAGINFANLYYQEWANNDFPKIGKYIKDFYWIYLLLDLIYSVFSHKEENYSFAEYIKPYFKKHIFHIESLSDPIPMILFWFIKIKNMSKFVKKSKY